MCRLAAFGPAQRELHRRARLGLGRRVRGAFVEHHNNVGVEGLLHGHGLLRAEENARAVHRRLERHTLLGNFRRYRFPACGVCLPGGGFRDTCTSLYIAQGAETPDLEAAGIGEDRAVPVHEAMQAAVRANGFDAGPEHKMEGITENNLGAGFGDLLRRQALDRAVGADRHERRRLDGPTREHQAPATRGAVRGQQVELHVAGTGLRASTSIGMMMSGTPLRCSWRWMAMAV